MFFRTFILECEESFVSNFLNELPESLWEELESIARTMVSETDGGEMMMPEWIQSIVDPSMEKIDPLKTMLKEIGIE